MITLITPRADYTSYLKMGGKSLPLHLLRPHMPVHRTQPDLVA